MDVYLSIKIYCLISYFLVLIFVTKRVKEEGYRFTFGFILVIAPITLLYTVVYILLRTIYLLLTTYNKTINNK